MISLRAGLLLFAVALGIYLLNGRFDESTDTFGNELLPISILQQHTLTFDQYFVDGQGDGAVAPGSIPAEFAYRVTPESSNDSLPWWFARRNGHVISQYPIVPGLLNTPAFAIASLAGVDLQPNVVQLTHVTTSLIAAASVLCMYLALLQVCAQRRTAIFLALNFAFATAVWSANSKSISQHGPALLFITGALAALLTRRPRLIALSGVLLGLAVANRPADIVLAAPIGIYVARHERRAVLGFVAGAALPMAFLAWYSWAYWGSPLAMGQGQGLSGFTAPEPLSAAVGLLISPNRGLLTFSPILVFAIGGAIFLPRRRSAAPLLWYLMASSVALYLMYTLWSDWAAGHSYGYRYLIEIVPALLLALGSAWHQLIQPQPILRTGFALAMGASIYVHGLGADASPCGFDDEPNNIDFHHERLWDVANGEVARCTIKEVDAWSARLGIAA